MDAMLILMLMLMLMSMYAIRMRYMWKKSKRLRLSGRPGYPLSPSPICARSPSPKTTWQGLHLLHILTRYWHLQNGFPQRFTFRKYYIAPGLRFFQISHANTDWQCKYTQNVTWGLNCALLPLENSTKTFLKLNLCTCVFSVHLWCATWFLCLLHAAETTKSGYIGWLPTRTCLTQSKAAACWIARVVWMAMKKQ